MRGVTDLEILFGNHLKMYKAGCKVTGTVAFSVTEEVTVTGLLLKFSGNSMVGFTRGTDKNKRHYIASEFFFRTEVNILKPSSSGNAVLSVGRHEFPFVYQLPDDIPSSFEGAFGFVRYAARATLQYGRSQTEVVRSPLIIFRPCNLNRIPDMRTYMANEASKTLGCLCCVSGSISANIWLEKRGFVPGEKIPLNALIHNNSSRRIEKTYFVIEELSNYFAQGKVQPYLKELKLPGPPAQKSGIPAGHVETWSGELTVTCPIVAPTNLEGCRIINTAHQLVLHVVPSGPSIRLRVSLDIMIGTEALTDLESGYQPSAQPQYSPTHFTAESRCHPRSSPADFTADSRHSSYDNSEGREFSDYGRMGVNEDYSHYGGRNPEMQVSTVV